MNWKEYSALSRSTERPDTEENKLFHSLLGMGGEFFSEIFTDQIYMSQLEKSEIIKELGDFMWYFAAYCKNKNIEPEYKKIDDRKWYLPYVIGCIFEYEKKRVFYEREEDVIYVTELINQLYSRFSDLCLNLHTNIDEVLDTNINKLKARYPEGFTIKDAEAKKDQQ